MKQMKFKGDDENFFYSADIAQMREDLNAYGMDASDNDIRLAWEKFSSTMAAGWMHYSKDELGTLISYLTPTDEEES